MNLSQTLMLVGLALDVVGVGVIAWATYIPKDEIVEKHMGARVASADPDLEKHPDGKQLWRQSKANVLGFALIATGFTLQGFGVWLQSASC